MVVVVVAFVLVLVCSSSSLLFATPFSFPNTCGFDGFVGNSGGVDSWMVCLSKVLGPMLSSGGWAVDVFGGVWGSS